MSERHLFQAAVGLLNNHNMQASGFTVCC